MLSAFCAALMRSLERGSHGLEIECMHDFARVGIKLVDEVFDGGTMAAGHQKIAVFALRDVVVYAVWAVPNAQEFAEEVSLKEQRIAFQIRSVGGDYRCRPHSCKAWSAG